MKVKKMKKTSARSFVLFTSDAFLLKDYSTIVGTMGEFVLTKHLSPKELFDEPTKKQSLWDKTGTLKYVKFENIPY